MKLIFCLDDNGGLSFNGRRQSRDRILIQDLLLSIGDAPLSVSPYSLPLFEGFERPIKVFEHPEEVADGYCFLECTDPAPYLPMCDEVAIYRWNRRYPDDLCFSQDMTGFAQWESYDFPGSSHEIITKEVWKK